jgi:hypothetical protein
MPKTDIDYTNTIIYKITCKDPTVTDVYVGHTTNFVQRKHAHKQSCTNTKSRNYKCKLYDLIRNNNGWDNWNMEIVNFFNCKDAYEARQKEQEYFILLNATLNSVEPLPLPKPKPNNVTMDIKECEEKKIYYCEHCDIHCYTNDLLNKHNDTKKHNAIVSGQKPRPEVNHNKNVVGFSCQPCGFKCYKEYNYKAHLATPKHAKFTKVYKSLQKTAVTDPTNIIKCKCSKTYTTRMGLWKHKQKCPIANDKTNDKTNDKPDDKTNDVISSDLKDFHSMDKDGLILKLLKDNEEIREILKEVLPKIGNNTIINNNNTTNNNNNMTNNFNLNVFLNEHCKDALNISEFVDSLKITFEDLLYSKKNGLVEGISNVMIRGLKELDIYKRPIHCTDRKRETMYIKDHEKWEKDETHEIMRNTIEKIADKERTALQIWTEENPDWIETERKQLEYLTMLRNVSEPIEDDAKNGRKIIRAVSREVIVDKKELDM